MYLTKSEGIKVFSILIEN